MAENIQNKTAPQTEENLNDETAGPIVMTPITSGSIADASINVLLSEACPSSVDGIVPLS